MITTFKIFNIKTKEVKEYSKPNFGDFGEYILIKADDFDTLAFNVEHTASFSDNKEETTEGLKTLAMAISVTYCKNRFYKNADHELNTLHNGLFKDCIYTSGDWVGVLQKGLKTLDGCHNGNIYTVGSVFFDKDTDGYCERSEIYSVLKYGKYYDEDFGYRNVSFGFYLEYIDKKNYKDYMECIDDYNHGIKNSPYSSIDSPYSSIDNVKKNHFKKTNPNPIIKKRPFSGKNDCCDLTVYIEGHSVAKGHLLDEYFAGGNKLAKLIL